MAGAGLLKEKVRLLPSRCRSGCATSWARSTISRKAFAAAVQPSDTPLATAIARYIRAELNLDVPTDAFRPDACRRTCA